jgi:hypothetical protein
MNIRISDRAITFFFRAVIATNIFLIVITALSDLEVPYVMGKLAMQADLKEEGVFAAWYSSLLLSLNSVAAFLIANSGSLPHMQTRLYRGVWIAAACVFLALSIDETAQIHERVGVVFSFFANRIPYLSDENRVFVLLPYRDAGGWVLLLLPFIVAFVAVIITVSRTWLAFNPRSRALALAAVACWVGVIIAELVEAQQVRLGMARSLQGAVEEGLEIVGSTLFLASFTGYLKATGKVAYLGARESTADAKEPDATLV